MVRIPSLRRSETTPAQDENGDGRVDGRDARAADDSTRVTEPITGSRRAQSARNGSRDEVVAPDRADETTTYRSRAATDGATGAAGATGTAASATAGDAGRGRTATMDRNRTATDDGRTATERSRIATDSDRTTTVDRPGDPATDRDASDRDAPRRPVTERPAPATGTARPASPPQLKRDTDADHEPEIAVVPGPKPRASLLATLSLITGVAGALFVLTGTLAGYGIGLGVLALLLSIGGMSATGRRHIAGKSDALIGLALGLGAIVVGVLALTGQFAWPSTDVDTVQRFREWLDSQLVDRF